MATEIYIHKMTEHMDKARITKWLVREGDVVESGQCILEVETEKAVVELEAPASGVVKGIRMGVVENTEVPVGEVIGYIADPDEIVPVLPSLTGSEEIASPTGRSLDEDRSTTASPPSGLVRATPIARRAAKDLGVDLNSVSGSGPSGAIRKEDVLAHHSNNLMHQQQSVHNLLVEADIPPTSPVIQDGPVSNGPGKEEELTTFREAVESDLLDLNAVQRITGQRMLESVTTQPQFTLCVHVDMSAILGMREAILEDVLAETGYRISITAILVKAVAVTLLEHPRVNSTFEGAKIRSYRSCSIGVAVGTNQGLVVPVIKDAGQKKLSQIHTEIKDFQEKAKDMRFHLDDLTGGTFTISNLGMYGIDNFSAIINPPQSAILAVGRIIKTPVVLQDDSLVHRPLAAFNLTVDHRVVDGMQAALFLKDLKKKLEQPYLML